MWIETFGYFTLKCGVRLLVGGREADPAPRARLTCAGDRVQAAPTPRLDAVLPP